ncbi:MAG: oligo-1,6-glucosidase [Cyclobacteriaceae bacterium]|jgi:oligo-1,6-glucosidase
MEKIWWKEGVVYQIYPRSFNDSNNDGIGDIPGIIEKLDYIKDLGVDIIWLCPVYKSPNDDNGYDISDYTDIMDEFGTMADFDKLLSEVKNRGLRLIMDLVVNHSSDEHKWFLDSRSSKDHSKRDYYIWRPAKEGGPPNNYQSFFGGDAWKYDGLTQEYYLHLFTKKQPDLNWENPELRQEIYKLMKFWLDKGIDGFRMDVISLISKRSFGDTPYLDFTETVKKVYANGPRVHEFLKEMHDEVIVHYDMMTVGEGPGVELDNALSYVSSDENELNMIFQFDHMFMDHGPGGKFDYQPYDLKQFKSIFNAWDKRLADKGWNSIFLGNHDFPRIVSRFGNDKEYWKESAKALGLVLQTLRGTAYIYQGDEIGMTNVAFDSISDYRDIETHNSYKKAKREGADMNHFMKMVHIQGRDNARTPMQWDDSHNAGFSFVNPWIKTNPNYKTINAQHQEHDSDSILNFYKHILIIRKAHPTLVYGDYQCIQPDHPQVFAYWRWEPEHVYLILINMSSDNCSFEIDDMFEIHESQLLLSNLNQSQKIISDSYIDLDPWEALLFKVN